MIRVHDSRCIINGGRIRGKTRQEIGLAPASAPMRVGRSTMGRATVRIGRGLGGRWGPSLMNRLGGFGGA